jgi:hypothetical protein
MWRWFLKFQKKPQKPLFRFQKRLGRKVLCSAGLEKKIEEEYGERLGQVFETTADFLVGILPTEVKRLSLIFDKKSPPGWPNKQNPVKFVLNLAKDPTVTKNQEEIKKKVAETQRSQPEIKIQPISFPTWQTHFEEGLVLAKTGKINAAIEKIEVVRQFKKGDRAVNSQLALLYFRRGEETGNIEDTLRAHDLAEEGGFDYDWWRKIKRARDRKQNVLDFDYQEEENSSD